jgi:hypothetical protein
LHRAQQLRHHGLDAIVTALVAEGFGVIAPRTVARQV